MICEPETEIQFDADTHTYRIDGSVRPSVTQILEAEGISDYSMVPPDQLKYAQDRGTAVHLAAWYDDMGRLKESSIDPAIGGYVEAWRKCKHDLGLEIPLDGIEQRVYCPQYRYCGTYDRRCRITRGKITGRTVGDLKTGDETLAWRLQLAGYTRLVPEPRGHNRVAFRLYRNGDYRLIHYPISEFRRDENVFLSLVNVHNYKKELGIA